MGKDELMGWGQKSVHVVTHMILIRIGKYCEYAGKFGVSIRMAILSKMVGRDLVFV